MSPNQIHLLVGTFALKMGQKGLKMGLKCFGLVWYGLVWLSCDPNWSEKKQKIQLPPVVSFIVPPELPEIRLSA